MATNPAEKTVKTAADLPPLPTADSSLPPLAAAQAPDQRPRESRKERRKREKRRKQEQKEREAERKRQRELLGGEAAQEAVMKNRSGVFGRAADAGQGCSRVVFNCRLIGCGFSLLFVAALIFVVYVSVSRPPAIVNPVKDWLNNGLVEHPHDGTTLEGASIELGLQVRDFKVGENTLVVTESQLKPLINQRLAGLNVKEIHVDIRDGELKLYWDITPTEERPLWLVLKFMISDEGIPAISYIGTQQLQVPGFLNDAASSLVISALNRSGVSEESDLIQVIIPLPDNVEIESIEFARDEMRAVVNVATGLEDIFNF